GPSGQEQQQYGQYRGTGYGAPAGYGQPQYFGGQGGNGYGQHGYSPPGYGPPGYQPGQGYDQPTQSFTYQGNGYQRNGDTRDYSDPRDYSDGRLRGNMRQYENPQRSDDQRYQVPGQGPGGPALSGQPSPDIQPPRKVRFRRTRRLFRLRSVRVVSAVL